MDAMTPLPTDYEPGSARRELETIGGVSDPASALLLDAASQARKDEQDETVGHAAVHLDWAAQLRQREGLSWAEALRAAEIFYYG